MKHHVVKALSDPRMKKNELKGHISAMRVAVCVTSIVMIVWFMLMFWEASALKKTRNDATGVYEYTYKPGWENAMCSGTIACVSMIVISALVYKRCGVNENQ